MKLFCAVLFLLNINTSLAQINIVPMPAEMKLDSAKTSFVLSPKTLIVLVHGASEKNAAYLNEFIKARYGFSLRVESGYEYWNADNAINIRRYSYYPANHYDLKIEKNKIVLATWFGEQFFNGLQTLFQLLPEKKEATIKNNYPLSIPQLSIKDYPRFPYRGMHLDVSRHFFSVDEVKKYIDFLAMYKFNTFHWHLTDDQGWRIEIKKYPLLTQVGSCRAQTLIGHYGTGKYDGKKYCGYYTQEQIKEVVAYANERYITIIPEIEMPGHAVAALTSYPYLGCTKGPYKIMETWGISDDVFCAGNDSTYHFVEDVLDEVMALFPSKYIHVGGDECPKVRWKSCPVCQKRIKDEGLKNETALQTYFVNRIERYINSKGKIIIGWNEILEPGLAPDAVIMSWQGEGGGISAAKQGHDVVMTPQSHCYFDHSQSLNEDSITFGGYTPLEKVYAYEPVPAVLSAGQAKHILGAQGNVWTEYIDNEQKLEYTIFPRMAALAEVLWSPKEKRDWKNFEQRIPGIFGSYREKNIHFSNAYYDLEPSVISLPENKIAWQLKTRNKEAHIIYREKEKDIPYQQPIVINESGTYEAAVADQQNNIISSFAKLFFNLNKATGKKITLVTDPSPSYPGSGAFTLVDGVQNTKGMAKSAEFLGFNGKDLDATIDLGEETPIKKVVLHSFQQTASWIYSPQSVNIYLSTDGKNFSNAFPAIIADGTALNTALIPLTTPPARFIRVLAKNYGIIPSENPGAGNPAWLFADEIEIQ